MPSRLQAQDLEHAYPHGDAVLRGVSLEVHAGERVVLLGPNGSGKSTLLRLMAGLLEPQAGQVRLDDVRLSTTSSRARARRIALLPQSLAAVPPVSVESFVQGGRYAHRGRFGAFGAEDRAAVSEALRDAEVEGFRHRPLAELSGGQRQRVLLARAFAQRAEFLLVDEPTSSLDPLHQVKVLELLERHARRGGAVLLVTHEFHHAQQFATRVLLLDQGRLVASGEPREVLCPPVLEPVYGACLAFHPGEGAPLVVPAFQPRREEGEARE